MQHLTGLGLVFSALLRILALYVLVAVLVQLTSRPRTRHALWLLFLIGAGIYWVTLLIQVLKPGSFVGVATHSLFAGVATARNSEATRVSIPFAWEYSVEFASGILIWTYAVGLTLMLFRLVRRRRSLRRAVAKARSVNSGLENTFETGVHHLGVSRCRILELPGLSSPGAAYTWSPVILVPEDLDSYLDGEQLIDVLYHELIHVRRLDFLWGTVGDVVGCLLFFHPAVWLALRCLGRERELACDGAVMELRSGRRTDYASSLVRLARRRVFGCQLDPSSHLALLNSFLAFRVQILLTETHRPSRGRQLSAVTGGAVALLVFCAGWSSLSDHRASSPSRSERSSGGAGATLCGLPKEGRSARGDKPVIRSDSVASIESERS